MDRTVDDDLIEGLKRGDPASAEAFVRTHIGRMRAQARRILKDDALADDCVQEAFMKAFRSIEQFEGRSSLGTWLSRIVINEALMKLRSSRRAQEDSIDDLLPRFDDARCRLEAPWSRMATPEEVVGRDKLRALVRAKVDELPDSYRLVLLLRDIEERDTAETAELLGISETNVKVRLHRARAALKKLLEPVLRGEVS